MKEQIVIIVSPQPLLRDGLKLLIEEAGLGEVATAPDMKHARNLMFEIHPNVVVIDRPDAGAKELGYFSDLPQKPTKVVVIGRTDDQLSIYQRSMVLPATEQNLIKAIRDNDSRTDDIQGNDVV